MSEQLSLEDIHSVVFKFKYGDPDLPCKVPGSVYLARRAKLPEHDIVRCDQILAALKGLGFLLGSAHINQYKNEWGKTLTYRKSRFLFAREVVEECSGRDYGYFENLAAGYSWEFNYSFERSRNKTALHIRCSWPRPLDAGDGIPLHLVA